MLPGPNPKLGEPAALTTAGRHGLVQSVYAQYCRQIARKVARAMSADQSLKCSECKIAAEVHLVNKEIDRITCPSCGVVSEGDAARQIYLESARYLALTTAQKTFGRNTARSRKSGITFSRNVTKPRKPSGPFIFGP